MAKQSAEKQKVHHLTIAERTEFEIRKTIRFKGGMSKFILKESGGNVSEYIKELVREKMQQHQKESEEKNKSIFPDL